MIKMNMMTKKLITTLLVLVMVFSFVPINMVYGDTYNDLITETPALVVTGSDIIDGEYDQKNVGYERAYSLDELKGIDNDSPYRYSSLNSVDTKKFHLANGVKIDDLLALSGISDVSEKKLSTISSDKTVVTIDDLGVKKYYYPNLHTGSEVNSEETPNILAWARSVSTTSTAPSSVDDSTNKVDPVLLLSGQKSISDQNEGLYNKEVNRLQLGNKISDIALTVDSTNYTRADLLLMPRAIRSYESASTTVALGVPIGELLKTAKNNDVIKFTSIDGTSTEMKKSKLVSGNYMLAYETGAAADSMQGVYGTSESKAGFLTLFGDGAEPLELVDTVNIVKGTDFTNSPYKHITNGGKGTDGEVNIYNIDAITSATVTVEGPSVKRSVPLSVRELESNDDSLHRGSYTDSTGTATYEGVDLAYLLTEMNDGNNGIILTDEAKKIQIKDINRKTVATLSIEDILDASERGDPVLLAYGKGIGDTIAPFVFTNPNPNQTNDGYIDALKNDDGCMKLVYNPSSDDEYTKFTNAAYIYVMPENEPGYKHNVSPYNDSKLKNYVIAFDGKELGREINLTTEQIEALSNTDLWHKDEYSLANNDYWYVNEYEGVKLWDFINYLGIPEEDATDNSKKDTVVKFTATDGYDKGDSFTYEELASPNAFGYYEKNADDLGNNTYVPKPEDLIKKGYPVLLASGVNRYPYVISSNDEGFMSGLSNDGGPMRVIFGKRSYGHANGSSQIQKLNNVTIGDGEYKYNTHKYNDPNTGSAYTDLADNNINISVSDEDGSAIKNTTFSVGEVEDMIYGSEVNNSTKNLAQSKAFYQTTSGGILSNDLYEGVNLEYFIWEELEIPGIKGDITFKDSDNNELTVSLEDLLKNGYNTTTEQSDLKSILAFAKNGSPMVESDDSSGFVPKYEVADGIEMDINNDGGPLSVILPADTADDTSKIRSLKNVTSIEIKLKADQYAHVKYPYDNLKSEKITIKGAGTYLDGEKDFRVEEIESKQTLAVTGDYNIKTDSDEKQLRYRGISLYDFLKSNAVGLRINANKVKVTSSNGTTAEFSLADIMKSNYINGQNASIDNLKPLLAYGSAPISENDKEVGLPLVKDELSSGYAIEYDNKGGPLKLVVGQKTTDDINGGKILDDIIEIEITALELDSWKHSVNDTYSQYLDHELKFVVKNSNSQWSKTFTVEELESMDNISVREDYSIISEATHEGLDFWKFVTKASEGISGIDNPVSVKCTSSDESKYTTDLLSNFGMKGLREGTDGKPIIIAYATNGYPLVPSDKSVGYTGIGGGNSYGPLRIYTEGKSGTCLKNLDIIEITIPGSGQIIPSEPEKSNFEILPSSGKDGELPVGASVRSITANQSGDMWIGTYTAGAYFKAGASDAISINTLKDGAYKLKSSVVTAVAEDSGGGIWFSQSGSYTDPDANKGAAYYKDGEITYFDTNMPDTILHDYVQEIKIDSKGNVWFGSFGGFTKYNPTADTWQTWDKDDGLPADSVNRIIIDENDGIWVGCYPDSSTGTNGFTGGYCFMDGSSNQITFTYEAQSDNDDGSTDLLADSWVRDIALDSKGGAWIVRSGSYGDLENVGGRIDYVDSNGNIKHFTGKGLLGSKLTNNSEIRALDVDNNGNLWLGAWNGVFVLNSDLSFAKEYSSSTGSWDIANMDDVYSLNIVGNTVYIGSRGGVAYMDNAALAPTLESIKITSKPIKTIYKEGESFNKTGMVVKGYYSNATEKVITNYTVDKKV